MTTHLAALASKYLKGRATGSEVDELHNWYDSWQDGDEEVFLKDGETVEAIKERILANILTKQENRHMILPLPLAGVRRAKWIKLAAAATTVACISSLSYYFIVKGNVTNADKRQQAVAVHQPVPDVPPGGDKAILTLADGTQVTLDSSSNGTISTQGNIKVLKLDDGQLAYEKSGGAKDVVVAYNTISTPRGGQYQVVLADGSKVWLNAASSLRFPTFFAGAERKVEITGEVYFEVAQNKAQPFVVSVMPASPDEAPMQVRVLGTHFNINAYSDEGSIQTTLLEGSVQVTKGAAQMMLKPGQQAGVQKGAEVISLANADAEKTVAWKDGRFVFNDNIKVIMRQIARWYDVEVVYSGNVTDKEFGGNISQMKNVSEVLNMLELTGGLQFKIDGRKITVMPGRRKA